MSISTEQVALYLFDTTHPGEHHRQRLVLATAARALAQVAGQQKQAAAASDAVLVQPLPGLHAEEQALVACVVALQTNKPRPEREVVFLRFDSGEQKTALRLAALLALANTLAGRAGNLHASRAGDELVLFVENPRALDAAQECGDRWRDQLGPLHVRLAEDTLPALPPAEEPAAVALPPPTTLPPGQQPFAEVAREELRFHFRKLFNREDKVRKDEDIEDVHQMRVATRRLRASLQVMAPVFEADLIKELRRKLRGIAEALGHVRDADVFLEHIHSYRARLGAPRQAELDGLIAAVQDERTIARADLLAELDSKRYQRFKQRFAVFLTTPGMGVAATAGHGGPLRMRDIAGSQVWRRYEELRAYETLLPAAPDNDLHEARIAGKRLRYTLEVFQPALGPGVAQCLAPLASLQDTLGSLQDCVVARERIERMGFANAPGARAYLARREAERVRLLRALPNHWGRVAGPAYGRRMLALLGDL